MDCILPHHVLVNVVKRTIIRENVRCMTLSTRFEDASIEALGLQETLHLQRRYGFGEDKKNKIYIDYMEGDSCMQLMKSLKGIKKLSTDRDVIFNQFISCLSGPRSRVEDFEGIVSKPFVFPRLKFLFCDVFYYKGLESIVHHAKNLQTIYVRFEGQLAFYGCDSIKEWFIWLFSSLPFNIKVVHLYDRVAKTVMSEGWSVITTCPAALKSFTTLEIFFDRNRLFAVNEAVDNSAEVVIRDNRASPLQKLRLRGNPSDCDHRRLMHYMRGCVNLRWLELYGFEGSLDEKLDAFYFLRYLREVRLKDIGNLDAILNMICGNCREELQELSIDSAKNISYTTLEMIARLRNLTGFIIREDFTEELLDRFLEIRVQNEYCDPQRKLDIGYVDMSDARKVFLEKTANVRIFVM
jgi:hypothetical protein